MKRILKSIIIVIHISVLVFLITGSTLFALEVPDLEYRINDQAGLLGESQERALEELLVDVENRTSSQVVLLTIPSLQGESLEDFSIRVATKNKIGQKEFDNGVLLLVALREKKIRIEVGYGLEHIVTDVKSGYIIRQIMVPLFKKGNYNSGIQEGLKAISGLITKDFEITPQQLAKYKKSRRKVRGKHIPFGVVVFIILIALNFIKGGGRRRGYHSGTSVFFWGGSSHHRGGGSGFGSGGFGGFSGGGGGFGGGGSSGGW